MSARDLKLILSPPPPLPGDWWKISVLGRVYAFPSLACAIEFQAQCAGLGLLGYSAPEKTTPADWRAISRAAGYTSESLEG